ncbi:MAG: YtxH domain-containing protein [Gemmatimonadota bacterium]
MADRDDELVVVERRGSAIGPFLAGMALGAGLALLVAPQSGEETRAQLARGARRVRRAAGNAAEDLAEKAEDTWRSARARVEARLDAVRDSVAEKGRQAKGAVDAGRDAARAARAELERRLADARGDDGDRDEG